MNWSAGKIGTIYQKPAHAIGLSTPPIPPIGCVLDLSGLSGAGNKIYDRSPYGNHGTIYGAVWKRLPSGLWCLDFDGTDDYVIISPFVFDIHTISFWIKPTATIIKATTAQILASFTTAQTDVYLGLGAVTGSIVDETFTIVKTDGGQNRKTGVVDVDITADFHLITIVWNAGLSRYDIYFDLDLQTVTAGTAPDGHANLITSNAFNLGRATSSFDGLIALPRIYNRALSALEIQNHYQQEKHLFGV